MENKTKRRASRKWSRNRPCLPLRPRFNAKWIPEPYSGCWLWTGSVKSSTIPGTLVYGEIHYMKKLMLAHRASWLLHKGEIPNGLDVLHHCDTPLCVNPDHLWLGTQKDNVDDMIKKGRKFIARGERAGSAKLTEDEVRQIRSLYRPGKAPFKNDFGIYELARQFGVSSSCVWSIIKGHWWRHVSQP